MLASKVFLKFKTILLFTCSFAFWVTVNGQHITNKKDTVYYLTFLELWEKDLQNVSRVSKDYDITNERNVMDRTIVKLLKDHFTLIPVPDSCYKKLEVDSVTRRSKQFMENICSSCKLTNKILLLDAIWTYEEEWSFKVLQREHKSSGVTASYWIIGTWWSVHASVYSPKEQNHILMIDKKYTQWSTAKPVKKWPGISHKRFFERPIKEVRKFLLKK